MSWEEETMATVDTSQKRAGLVRRDVAAPGSTERSMKHVEASVEAGGRESRDRGRRSVVTRWLAGRQPAHFSSTDLMADSAGFNGSLEAAMSINQGVGSEHRSGPSGQGEEAGSGMLREAHERDTDGEKIGSAEAETVEGTEQTVQEEAQASIDVVDVDSGMPLVMLPGTEDEPLADHSGTEGSAMQGGETP